VGLVRVKDAETGREMLIDSASKNLRNNYRRWWEEQKLRLDTTFKKSKVDAVSVSTAQDYVKALMALFNLRN
jgi:molybdopterin-guanine dinucleotide biosynthesis protein A